MTAGDVAPRTESGIYRSRWTPPWIARLQGPEADEREKKDRDLDSHRAKGGCSWYTNLAETEEEQPKHREVDTRQQVTATADHRARNVMHLLQLRTGIGTLRQSNVTVPALGPLLTLQLHGGIRHTSASWA